MKPRDIFGIAVRLLGLLFIWRGLVAVPEAADELFRGIINLDPYRMFAALWAAGWPFIAAYWLVRGAPPFSQLAYPDPPGASEKKQSDKN